MARSFLELIDVAVASHGIHFVIKPLFLLAATALIACLLRRRGAATLHRLWMLAFCGVILLPCVPPLLPIGLLLDDLNSWSPIPVSIDRPLRRLAPATKLESAPTGSIRLEARTTDNGPGLLNHQANRSDTGDTPKPETSQDVEELKTATDRIGRTGAATVYASNVRMQLGPMINGFRFVFCIWALGIACFASKMLNDHWTLARLLLRSEPILDAAWDEVALSAARLIGLKRRFELRSVPNAMTPMIAGIVRPIILVPFYAYNWDTNRRRLVLLHEMAHAKRHDLVTQRFVQFVCLIHWFNPLVWYGLSQVRKLRELACDDLVLESGQRASDYAHALLEVARTRQHHVPAMAVGMARGCEMENRIRAILDNVRSHVSLSRRAARSLLVLTTLICVCVGSLRLQSRADQTPQVEKSQRQAKSQTDPDAEKSSNSSPAPPKAELAKIIPANGMMKIQVRDEQGNPVSHAKIHCYVVEILDAGNKTRWFDVFTGDDGLVDLTIAPKLWLLRLWISAPKLVPLFVSWEHRDKGTQDIGSEIPSTFEFTMKRGRELRGRVVDEEGRPIPGVRVLAESNPVKLQVKKANNSLIPEPGEIDSESAVVTDQDGWWLIDTLRGRGSEQQYELKVQLRHNDYLSDIRFGDSQGEQGVSTAMLIGGQSTLVMKRGQRISGAVVDSAGNPVKHSLVIWHDDRVWRTDHEVFTDDQGHFETKPLKAGEYPISVFAAGLMSERFTVRVDEKLAPQRFVLKPGNRLVVKVVGPDGHGLPGAYVTLKEWRGIQFIFGGGHAKGIEIPIANNADDQGTFTWDSAPEDAVRLIIQAKGYSDDEVSLAARDTEHVVRLVQAISVSGKVTDAITGLPISDFMAIPVDVFRPDRPNTDLMTDYRNARKGREGRYSIDTFHTVDERRFTIRLEAPGYRSQLSDRTFGGADGAVTIDFAMEPAAGLQGRVIRSSGQPVADANVIQGTPTIVPHIPNNQLDAQPTRFELEPQRIKTDADGRFQLPASFEPAKIRVIHSEGFAEVLRQVDEPPGTIVLQPWAKVSGVLKQDGVLMRNQWIVFHQTLDGRLGEPRFQAGHSVETDADGRFEFDRLPPFTGSLRAMLGPWKESPLKSSQSVPLALKPGEHRVVALGGDGASLTGKVVATGRGEVELNRKWSINWLIRRDGGIELPDDFPVLGFDPAKPMQPSWRMDDCFDEWRATRDHYFVKLSRDGDINVSGVPAGQYELLLQLFEQPEGCLVESVGQRVVAIRVTDSDVTAGKKELGQIEVECRVGPKIHQNMQAYRFIDVSGREQRIYDLKGQYVLMHVWAGWCSKCRETMGSIHATVKNSAGKPITFVGLNIDDDKSRAKELVAKNGWDWSQNYLGDHSDMMKQLAVSSVPTYYLIDPKGLLVTSTTDWSVMEQKIESIRDPVTK